jgi:hypothetical protein
MFLRKRYIGLGRCSRLVLVPVFVFACIGIFYGQDRHRFLVGKSVDMIDGNVAPYNLVSGGDTIFILPGMRENLLIRNFHGTPDAPVTIMNLGGPVIISTTQSYGFAIRTSRYIRFTGSGDPGHFYGFNFRLTNGAGLSLDDMSSDCEVDHISIEGSTIAGLYAKTDPDCSFEGTRDQFTQYNTRIHDNYIDSVGNEGMYVGSTKYSGELFTCNGRDTVLYPSLLKGVRIYNNIVKYTGWDGIQVSSADSDCQVYNNIVLYDSQGETDSQMTGIILGGGSKCDCFNNIIRDGEGDGIEIHGLGGSRIFNNLIENPGRSYYPNDPGRKKYGIYVSDVSVQPDSSFYILFNDIISPKSEGIHFSSVISRNNMIVSNVIIDPGDTGSYLVLTDTSAQVLVSHNFFAPDTLHAGFFPEKYDLQHGSPLVDEGYSDNRNIRFDLLNRPRPSGSGFDIGAYEFQHPAMGISSVSPATSLSVFPNPARDILTIRYEVTETTDAAFDVFSLTGQRISHTMIGSVISGSHSFHIEVGNLPAGIYLYLLKLGDKFVSGKFIRVGD